MSLSEKSCVPCRGDVPPLPPEEVQALLNELPAWSLVDGHLYRRFDFPDFATALALLNQVAALAEVEGHHPDLLLAWGRLEVTIYTHAIQGLTESDFVLAAKIDRLRR